jgi:mannan endo-1,6-alpha-mannosidase
MPKVYFLVCFEIFLSLFIFNSTHCFARPYVSSHHLVKSLLPNSRLLGPRAQPVEVRPISKYTILSKRDISSATDALQSLISQYYNPSPSSTNGTFDTSLGPWWESGTIWQTFADYTAYSNASGTETASFISFIDAETSNIFADTFSTALTRGSFNGTHDFLGDNHTFWSTAGSRWNDDIEWWAEAVVAGGELFGGDSAMAGYDWGSSPSAGSWLSLAQKTVDEVYEFYDERCGGGLLWVRDASQNSSYKSSITNLLFLSLGARTAMLGKNETVLAETEKLFEWVVSSGTVNLTSGVVNDGIDANNCGVNGAQWSYTYGVFVGSLAWLSKATGNSTYLALGAPFITNSISLYAPNGIVREPCEYDGTCNNDQQIFKGIYLRNLVYYYRASSDPALKISIADVVRKSAAAAINTCNKDNWICKGTWVSGTNQSYPDYRALALVGAALVAEIGLDA